MKSFRTEIKIEKKTYQINYKKKLFFIGSCFTENIGSHLKELKYPILINPFGILYNPISVLNSLELIINKKFFSEKDLFFLKNKYLSFFHHGDFSDENKDICLQKINNSINSAHHFLKNTNYLLITFGTSWVFENKETKEIVANCHKIPSHFFNRYLLNIQEIVKKYQEFIKKILNFNPNLEKIIFTISPVRHWKDGANGNQISKSILQIAINELKKSNSIIDYFPSYEIVLDDLRDYRFYESDMLHPNKIAVEYIWEKFQEAFIDEKDIFISKQIKKIIDAKKHRFFYPKSEETKKFKQTFLKKVIELKSKYPFLDLSEEYSYFKSIQDN